MQATVRPAKSGSDDNRFLSKFSFSLLFKQRTLILMSFPFFIWLLIFAYFPIWGWVMAFQDYKPVLGILESPFVGLKHFERLLTDTMFIEAFRNTVGQAVWLLVVGFPMPIMFALLLNEVRLIKFKKITQTISYLPYFVSWVITISVVSTVMSTNGVLNEMLIGLGIIETPVLWLGQANIFWPIFAITDTWKNVGWNAIIYLAAIVSIDPTLYEAASVDGAGRWRKMWHITLPSIAPLIIILLVLNIGHIVNVGFERQLLMGNPLVHSRSVSIDQYALEYGLGMARFSYGTAVGMFKSVVSVTLLFIANRFARKLDAGVF
ncbi:MAG: ABC transporter permease subunit [Oscillospiraceae bacterium]|nr:ABC transporter permease subunit [Oscillospiraceae bacterium]